MSNDNNSTNPPRLLPNGAPNIEGNPRILAAFLDLIGTNMTHVLMQTRDSNGITDETPIDGIDSLTVQMSGEHLRILCEIQRLLSVMRHSVGIGRDWHEENLYLEVHELRREREAQAYEQVQAVAKLAKMMGIPLPPDVVEQLEQLEKAKPVSAADAADAILNDLRTDGVIG